ncbi:hypothetical protein VPHD479_0283 [Vibrio phage D479]
MHKMKLVVGDWSDDGHGKSREVVFEVNHPVEVIQQAYKDACKLTGVQFNHNEDYTGRGSWSEGKRYQICADYEQSALFPETVEILREFEGFDEHIDITEECNEYYIESSFEELWWWFVSLALPDVEYHELKDEIPPINGWWNKNLNVQFGYGLFY